MKSNELDLKIESLLATQMNLNNETCGEGWEKTGVTKDGKKINWDLCLYSELNELMDCFPWKHWKYMEFDEENMLLELADILCFSLSKTLSYRKENREISVSDIEIMLNIELKDSTDYQKPLYYITKTFRKLGLNTDDTRKRVIIETDAPSPYRQLNDLISECLSLVNKDLDYLIAVYLAKVALNKLRVEIGYNQDSKYVKNWYKGMEDNKILFNEYYIDSISDQIKNLHNSEKWDSKTLMNIVDNTLAFLKLDYEKHLNMNKK